MRCARRHLSRRLRDGLRRGFDRRRRMKRYSAQRREGRVYPAMGTEAARLRDLESVLLLGDRLRRAGELEEARAVLEMGKSLAPSNAALAFKLVLHRAPRAMQTS